MKTYYHSVSLAALYIVSTLETVKGFISKVGYPVKWKPNNGVGSSYPQLGKFSNDRLEDFYKNSATT